MQGVDSPELTVVAVDRPPSCDESLARHLAAENPLAVLVRADPSEDIDFDRFREGPLSPLCPARS
jgi:hypothetical protein